MSQAQESSPPSPAESMVEEARRQIARLEEELASTRLKLQAMASAAAEGQRALERTAWIASIVESSDDAIISKTPDGTITSWNAGAQHMYGYTPEEIIGKSVRTIVPEERFDELEFLMNRVVHGERVEALETVRIAKDGRRLQAVVSLSPVRDSEGRIIAISAIGRDITPWKRIEETLRASEARLSLALQIGRMGAWELNIKTQQLVWSPSLEAIHGLAPGTFGGTPEEARRFIHPDDLDQVLANIEDAMRECGSYEVSYRIILPDGTTAWVEARGRVLVDSQGKPDRFIGVCVDVTERKRFEEVLEEQTRRKDEFLAVLSHELRNPLAPILNCLQILRTPGVTAALAEKSWSTLERQVSHLGRLIEDLLDVSRISSGNVLLDNERLDLVELVRATVQDHQALLENRGLSRSVELPERPMWVWGDATRLSQALGNLIHNSAKFTDPGGRVAVTLSREGEFGVIVVLDTGIGVDPQELPRLFEPFNRADHGRDHTRAGLGLGLALVRAMIGLHGGTVEGRSEGPGKGAEFVLRLPLVSATSAPGTARSEKVTASPIAAPASVAEPGGRRILLIEDNVDAAESMGLLLGLAGHQVAVAGDGVSGIELARTFHPQAILCDIGLPGRMDGYAVARALRADPQLGSTVLIALTGYGQPEDQRRSTDAGFDAHLTKPIRRDDLERLLATIPA